MSKTLLAGFLLFTLATSAFAEGFKIDPVKEKELIAILQSAAAPADKAIACKKLAIDGSAAAVPDLAKLLPDPQLHSWARIALEAIPGPEADEALRKAADSLEGRLLVGALNSIGVRRDANAVDGLTKRLADKDAEVVAAAAVALGRIGNAAAAKSLQAALAAAPANVKTAVAEGCVLGAENLHIAGKSAEAIVLYDAVRKAEVSPQRKLEATRGAILARNQEGLPLLVELFQSSDKRMYQLALGTAREFPGSEIDKTLAAELAKAKPEQAALLIQAMADRPQTVVLAAVLKAAGAGPKPVRLSALNAISRVGDATCVPALLAAAVDADAEIATAAKASLADLPGDKINEQIAALLPKAEGKSFAMLIELVGQRRIEATPALLKALDNTDKTVRAAALSALGETVSLKGLHVLISNAIAPKHAEDAAAAQLALKAASVRMPDREACAAELATAYDRAQAAATKSTLLEILGAVGGTKALAVVGAAAKSTDATLQDTSTKLLGEWSTADAAPVLLDLSKSAPGEKYQVRALRGYIRIARQFVLPDAQRAKMCETVLDIQRPAEQKLVIDILKRYPSVEMFKVAQKAKLIPDLKDDATQATLIIAQKLSAGGADVTELLSKVSLEKVKLEIVKAEYGSGSTQKDVTVLIRKQAGDLPLINLAEGYNAVLGGDPAPGTVKQLKIQYKINGKAGEATFAENALIVLPMPK